MAAPLTIDRSHPALPGHFPGRPIVPGVVILERVIEAARPLIGEGVISGVRRVKFLHLLEPGRAFVIEFDPQLASGLRFRVVCENLRIAEGQLTLSRPSNETTA